MRTALIVEKDGSQNRALRFQVVGKRFFQTDICHFDYAIRITNSKSNNGNPKA